MPPFHAGSFMPTLFDAIPNQTTIVFPLPNANMSADQFHSHFIACIKYTRPDTTLIPASYIHELAQNPEMLDLAAKSLEYIIYTGGDVADRYGDIVSARCKLFAIVGSTEHSCFPAIRPSGPWDRSVWKYIMPHPCAGVDFRCYSWDGGDPKYEAVIVRNPQPVQPQLQVEAGIQAVFTVYPHLAEYHTGDLFSPHLSRPGLWKYRGRADDCFVLVTGSNINPLTMENRILVHPDVRAVLMLGQRRPRPGLLIELAGGSEIGGDDDSEKEKAAVLERLWPAIQDANGNYYEQARVGRDRVLFTTKDRPMKRTPKGTVQRRATLEMYRKEIEEMYEGVKAEAV